jgi:hypothetical protein
MSKEEGASAKVIMRNSYNTSHNAQTHIIHNHTKSEKKEDQEKGRKQREPMFVCGGVWTLGESNESDMPSAAMLSHLTYLVT